MGAARFLLSSRHSFCGALSLLRLIRICGAGARRFGSLSLVDTPLASGHDGGGFQLAERSARDALRIPARRWLVSQLVCALQAAPVMLLARAPDKTLLSTSSWNSLAAAQLWPCERRRAIGHSQSRGGGWQSCGAGGGAGRSRRASRWRSPRVSLNWTLFNSRFAFTFPSLVPVVEGASAAAAGRWIARATTAVAASVCAAEVRAAAARARASGQRTISRARPGLTKARSAARLAATSIGHRHGFFLPLAARALLQGEGGAAATAPAANTTAASELWRCTFDADDQSKSGLSTLLSLKSAGKLIVVSLGQEITRVVHKTLERASVCQPQLEKQTTFDDESELPSLRYTCKQQVSQKRMKFYRVKRERERFYFNAQEKYISNNIANEDN